MMAAYVFYIIQDIVLSTKHFTIMKPLIFNESTVLCLHVCVHWTVSLFSPLKEITIKQSKDKEELHNQDGKCFKHELLFHFISLLTKSVWLSIGVSHTPHGPQWRTDVKRTWPNGLHADETGWECTRGLHTQISKCQQTEMRAGRQERPFSQF